MADLHGKIGRYEVVSVLGRGAMGVVYKARDPIIDRLIAVKKFSTALSGPDVQNEEYYRRFLMEAKAVGRLKHPNIVILHDVGEEDGVPFMAMELIDGGSLADLMKSGEVLSISRSVSIIRQVASGLGHAHDNGIIHRDIKPANLLIDGDDRAVVTDFGVARLQESDVTRSGEVLGTPHYMSPEQVQGEQLDGRSDLFSLGVVFYSLLTGRRPFKGDTLTTICYNIVHSVPEPISPGLELPEELVTVVNRMLSKNREERQQSMKELISELDALDLSSSQEILLDGTATIDLDSDSVNREQVPPVSMDSESGSTGAVTGQQFLRMESGKKWLWIGLSGLVGIFAAVVLLVFLAVWLAKLNRTRDIKAPVENNVAAQADLPGNQSEPIQKSGLETKSSQAVKPLVKTQRLPNITREEKKREKQPVEMVKTGSGRGEKSLLYSLHDRTSAEVEVYTRRAESAAASGNFLLAYSMLEDGKEYLNNVAGGLSEDSASQFNDLKIRIDGTEKSVDGQLAKWAASIVATSESTYSKATDSFNDDEDGIIKSYVQLWPVLKYKSHLTPDLAARCQKLVKNCRENLSEDEWARAQALATGKPLPKEEDEDDE